ncbi:aminoacyl-tRNA hydrolase [Loigolactobacillus backii]|uniref:Peptidyl-tRNA hydrolase n=1 Tax=Loigolactobacillus backii TaxID=375175 RepID=A0A192GZ73_9LACO|nr:aminoacyl-tRNA hydrolase [Loigolactobacillus backii]ANK58998.1 aminoacyl-tRNA hydrolase [Loigolactobacillus backii]ANK61333.1 aminoacyl-tRNA hydrolase [Loigolactobacillus backii]ANK63986.1 aminoacyl-tRNA hydrolase [Loigolactobacillus backii]ANK66435.1 aminoacyl-tRNA hydrolase [Loigolactobacillus backii]ANK69467.1 aminoacyl-tRNA hydrolase [Loigolactobacillus backii]
MKMIVGLGNPGKKYAGTKHNVGFMTIDSIAKAHDVTLNKNEFEANYGTFFLNGEKVFLVKPQTYMNDSGRAVKPLMTYYQVQLDELLVIYDDMDLPAGKIRLRQHGSAGGHNGIKSMISYLRTSNFNRIRIGTDHPGRGTVVDWVLTPFAKNVRPLIDESIEKASAAVESWTAEPDFMQIMNQYNRKG